MQYPGDTRTILRHLQNMQWWPADVMQRHQFELLEELVRHAYRTVPFYRERFDAAGLSIEEVTSPDRWHAVPLLTREDIQTAGKSLHSQNVPGEHGQISQQWTGGSTGKPVMVLTTDLTGNFWRANSIREHQWQRRDFRQKMAVIRHVPSGGAEPPEGHRLPNWGVATVGLIETGPCAVLNVKSTVDQQAAWLTREQPAYLQTYPSLVYELAGRFADSSRCLPSLRQVLSFGEVLEPKVREMCRRAWKTEVVDAYSSNEVGHIAIECSEGGTYHIQSEHLLVEIFDDEGKPCRPGDVGRVILTTLYNYAMPLIRYDIGDYAQVGKPCSCGRKLPTLSRILGRQRNMFVLPSGEKRWPGLDVDLVAAFGGRLPIRQFQAIQRRLDEIEVKLVVARRLEPAEEQAIRTMLDNWFGHRFEVRFTYVDEIPRSPTGKFEDFRCDLAADDSKI